MPTECDLCADKESCLIYFREYVSEDTKSFRVAILTLFTLDWDAETIATHFGVKKSSVYYHLGNSK